MAKRNDHVMANYVTFELKENAIPLHVKHV